MRIEAVSERELVSLGTEKYFVIVWGASGHYSVMLVSDTT